MFFIETAIFILLFAIISVPFATRFKLPLEVFLVIGSCFISFMPGIPQLQISPVIVFYLFLPPILFYAAYFTSWNDFKINIRPITLLAVLLVLVSTVLVAVVIKWILPSMSWSEGFLLGAIISPTDASSATAIIKKIGAPRQLITILEGESLINDATALVLFRFALASILAGSFSISEACIQFIGMGTGGVGIGLLMGFFGVTTIQKIHSAPAETTFILIIPFITYLIAEHLGVSGIIATVTCGIYFGVKFPELAISQTRINATTTWKTLIFIINGFIFTLIGLQLETILKNQQFYSIPFLILTAITISLVVIIIRLFWVFFAAHVSRWLLPQPIKNKPLPPSRTLFILGWSGMRGIVSLAAALSIPYQLTNGQPFPHRDLFLFITYAVIVSTLIIPTLTLPFFLQFFHLRDTDNKLKQEALARIYSLQGVLAEIDNFLKEDKIPETIFSEFKAQIERKLSIINTQLYKTPYSTLNEDYLAIKKLTLAAIESERATLLKLRKNGEIQDDVFHILTNELDLEEMRSKTLRL